MKYVYDTVTQDWVEVSKLTNPIMRSRRPSAADNGYYQISSSNGVPSAQVTKAESVDRQLGVPIKYIKNGPLAYAAFESRSQKNSWLRAHRRVDHDAGYREPAPGDFVRR